LTKYYNGVKVVGRRSVRVCSVCISPIGIGSVLCKVFSEMEYASNGKRIENKGTLASAATEYIRATIP